MLNLPTPEDIYSIKLSYAEVVRQFNGRTADGNNLHAIQETLNNNARRIYDKFGRIILQVGQDEYIDITSPRASFALDTIQIHFTEVYKDGRVK